MGKKSVAIAGVLLAAAALAAVVTLGAPRVKVISLFFLDILMEIWLLCQHCEWLVWHALFDGFFVLMACELQPGMLMSDGGLEASTIDMDHDAMLASNPKKNAAFMRVFGSYVGGNKKGDTLSSPATTTQLAQQQHSSHKGQSDLNAKLAKEMQSQLTAGSQDDEMMTPHCEFMCVCVSMCCTSVFRKIARTCV